MSEESSTSDESTGDRCFPLFSPFSILPAFSGVPGPDDISSEGLSQSGARGSFLPDCPYGGPVDLRFLSLAVGVLRARTACR